MEGTGRGLRTVIDVSESSLEAISFIVFDTVIALPKGSQEVLMAVRIYSARKPQYGFRFTDRITDIRSG